MDDGISDDTSVEGQYGKELTLQRMTWDQLSGFITFGRLSLGIHHPFVPGLGPARDTMSDPAWCLCETKQVCLLLMLPLDESTSPDLCYI
ncbi:hypothetical protein Tco_0003270 [Tanacetum coccineum]